MKYVKIMFEKSVFLFLIIFTVISTNTFSQQDQFSSEHITIQEGLTNNQIYTIGQDKQGFMWFGTPSGLNRYDGYNIKVYSHMPHYGKSPIFEDNYGSLWMICWGNEIYRLNLITEKFTNYPYTGRLTVQLYKDYKGGIWAATRGNGFAKYIQSADSFIVYKHNVGDSTSLNSDTVYTIFEDSKNNIWIGTQDGLNLFDPQKLKFRHLNCIKKPIVSITEDRNGIIWAGSISNLIKIDKSTLKFKLYNDKKLKIIEYIYIDSKNNIWLSTDLGILGFDRYKENFINYSNFSSGMPDNTSHSEHPILEDNYGKIWNICRLQAASFNPKLQDFTSFQNDPFNDIINDFFKDKAGNLWSGTNQNGIYKIDNDKKPFSFFPKKSVTSLFVIMMMFCG